MPKRHVGSKAFNRKLEKFQQALERQRKRRAAELRKRNRQYCREWYDRKVEARMDAYARAN